MWRRKETLISFQNPGPVCGFLWDLDNGTIHHLSLTAFQTTVVMSSL